METKGIKEDLRKMILDMTHKEFENNSAQKGARKYFMGNVEKAIDDNIKEMSQGMNEIAEYSKVLKLGSDQDSMLAISKMIRKQEVFRSKNELLKFARHIGINVNKKNSYNQILRKISNNIYTNRYTYSKKYVSYKKGHKEYILEPEKIKEELVENYRSKATKDMRSIAKLLDMDINDVDRAEDIRKKVINYIIKEKLTRKSD